MGGTEIADIDINSFLKLVFIVGYCSWSLILGLSKKWSYCSVQWIREFLNSGHYFEPFNLTWYRQVSLTRERSSQLCTQLKQLRKESLKKRSGLNGIRPHNLRNTGAVVYYWATKSTQSWLLCEFVIQVYPQKMKTWKWIYKTFK